MRSDSLLFGVVGLLLAGCVAVKNHGQAPSILNQAVTQGLALTPGPDSTASDPAQLELEFFLRDGKQGNFLTGKTRLYHVIIIKDGKTDLKAARLRGDAIATEGNPDPNAPPIYTDGLLVTGSDQVKLTFGLYDQNGIGNTREEKLKQLTKDLEVFPPINAWSVAGIQAIKLIAIVPAIWDFIFPDEPLVPEREITIFRKVEHDQVKWVLPRTEFPGIRGSKIVLRLISGAP